MRAIQLVASGIALKSDKDGKLLKTADIHNKLGEKILKESELADQLADKDSDLRFRSTIGNPGLSVARDYYEKKVRRPNESGTVKKYHNLAWRAYEGYLDSMAALKALMDGVVKETGNSIPSYADAYKAENAMSSASKAQAEAYERDWAKD